MTVSLTGADTATTTTNANGNFSFNNLLADRNYTVTPKLKNYSFQPKNATIYNLGDNAVIYFTGTKLFATNLKNVIAYPNPFKSGEGTDYVTFGNLTENATIEIYSISGRLIKTLKPDAINYQWDLKDENGNSITVGIYIYYITDSKGNKTMGKIAIVK